MNQHAEQIELTADLRTERGKQVKSLRRAGLVPATMYGHGFEAMALQFEEKRLSSVLSRVSGSHLIQIHIPGSSQPEVALVREAQRDVITRDLLHVDFYRVSMTERIRAEIPIVLVNESPMVASAQGILITGISSLEVECLPGDLVEAIEVSLTSLTDVDQSITVADLPVPSGIQVLTDADEMVARIVPSHEMIEEELEEVEEVSEDVEVIARGKEEADED